MNRLHKLLAALGIAAIALAACGGGGGGSMAPNTTAQAPVIPSQLAAKLNKATPLPAAVNHGPRVATANLTLVLPHVLTGKNAQAIRAMHGLRTGMATTRKGSASALASARARAGTGSTARRSPKYVDPIACQNESCPPNLIDIYVNGYLLSNLDGCAGSDDSICVSPTADGTQQNISIPLYSQNTNDIVVEEFDPCGEDGCEYYPDLLAVGDTWIGSGNTQNFSPGSTVSATVTMQMNAQYVGIVDIYNQAQPAVMTGRPWYGVSGTCNGGGPYPQDAQFGLYTADGLGNFVPVAGYGGTSTPTETAVSDNGGSTITPQTAIPGLWFVSWDNNCDGVTVTGTATNPAYAASYDVLGPYPQDIESDSGFDPYYTWSGCSPYSYYNNCENYGNESPGGPFDSQGNATWGYLACMEGNGPCPGGPYQAIWNIVWWYDDSYYPAYILYSDVSGQVNGGGPVVSGSVDVQDAPSPSPSSSPCDCG